MTIESKKYKIGSELGSGVWADVFKGTGPEGEKVAVKMLRGLGKKANGEVPPRNREEQKAENLIESKIHKWIQKKTIADGAMVPRMFGSDGTNAAIEFVEAQPFVDYLRTKRSIADDAEIAKVSRVCAIVLRKVLTLCASLKYDKFSHRDLNTGNIMINIKDETVASPDDVDVWLIDFGKSMAMIDGKMVSGGMWDMTKKTVPIQGTEKTTFVEMDHPTYDSCRARVFNPTTDTVRVVSCIIQDLIRSYKEEGVKTNTAPSGETRTFLEEKVPFAATLTAWLAHTKVKIGDKDFNNKWEGSLNSGDRKTQNQSGNKDFLDFATQPSFPIMIAYYVLRDEADLCKEMLPESIIGVCNAIIENAGGVPWGTTTEIMVITKAMADMRAKEAVGARRKFELTDDEDGEDSAERLAADIAAKKAAERAATAEAEHMERARAWHEEQLISRMRSMMESGKPVRF